MAKAPEEIRIKVNPDEESVSRLKTFVCELRSCAKDIHMALCEASKIISEYESEIKCQQDLESLEKE